MFERSLVNTLVSRMQEPRNFIQVVVGPRQTGKSTAIGQALDKLSIPTRYKAADDSLTASVEWLANEWRKARSAAFESGGGVLVIDEIQKVSHWSSKVKELWDEDTRNACPLKVVLSGSSSLLLQKRMEDSLMGRFEVLYSHHWNLVECAEAFGYSLDDFLYHGGYPGAATLKDDQQRWKRYLRTSIVNPTIDQDILAMERVEKPALMRALFALGAAYSAQELSYTKMIGQLQDAGNTTTVAHYLELLDRAGMVRGLQKFASDQARIRRSSPRLAVHDTSLMAYATGATRQMLLEDPQRRSHLVESAIGAFLIAQSVENGFDLFWYRTKEGKEVDFVVQKADAVAAIEVESGRVRSLDGALAFLKSFPDAQALVIGKDCSIEEFLCGTVPLFS
jgi:uncharacterized protein